MQLSPHFVLDEFMRSGAAVRMGIDMTPPAYAVAALTTLAVNVLEPLRVRLGRPIRITSGYRPARLNTAIGGAPTSQHLVGQAADIQVDGLTPLQLCHAVLDARLPFDQLIYEFGPAGWTHVSHKPDGARQRGQVLTAYHTGSGATAYDVGLPA
ncbi:MAG: peptidase M15A [Proteobacteria bacterium]|nr:peptidase M15A [Pseudomonadota bacterium]